MDTVSPLKNPETDPTNVVVLTVLFDLDETLVSAENLTKKEEEEIFSRLRKADTNSLPPQKIPGTDLTVFVRPYWKEFIEYITELTKEKKSKLIRLGKISYDIASNIIWKDNKKIFLTYKEGLVLKELINSNGVAIDRYSLTNKLQLGERSIDITISRLRKKIEDNPKLPEYILTDRGKGYIINNQIRENL